MTHRLLESRRLRQVTRSSGALFAILLGVAVVGGTLTSGAMHRILVNFLITVTIAVGLQSFVGNSGIVSYGHAAFVGVGAYVTAWVTVPAYVKELLFPAMPAWLVGVHFSYVPAVLVAMLAGVLFAAAVGIIICRMKPGAMAMGTFGLLVIVHGIFANWTGMTRGMPGVYALPTRTSIWAALAAATLAIVATLTFKYSRTGLKLQATRENPLSAETTGVGLFRVRYAAWILSASICAAAGSIWAQFNLGFGPSQFYFAAVFASLAIIVVGGLATVSGAVVGACLITVVFEVLRGIEDQGTFFGLTTPSIPGLTQMVVALITLLMLIYRRDGIMSWWELDVWASKGWRRLRSMRAKPSAAIETEREDAGHE